MPFTLSPLQRAMFERLGVVRLPRFYARADMAAMADQLWADLEKRYGMRRDRPDSWTTPLPAKFDALRQSGAFRALGSSKLFALADSMLGAGHWNEPGCWGRPLVSFPTALPALPRPPWHLDIGGTEWLDPLPTLRVFAFPEPVLPHGGGTLYVAGSHRIAMDIERAHGMPVRSAQVRDRLKAEHGWFANLLDTPTAGLRALIGVESRTGHYLVRLEEMTGEPGDLIVMHPAILHGTAHVARDRPRMMLTEWIARRSAASGA